MTHDDIIRMAREADPFGVDGRLYAMAQLTPETLERFAALVVSAEREECAKVCDEQIDRWTDDRARYCASECAATIRARSQA